MINPKTSGLLFILFYALTSLFYQTSRAQDALNLIPVPKRIIAAKGTFTFTDQSRIGIADSVHSESMFSALNLAQEISNCYQFDIRTTTTLKETPINIGIIGRDPDIDLYLSHKGLRLPDSATTEGYILNITSGKIVIAAATEAGLFYGVQTLKQLIRSNSHGKSIACMNIIDWPVLRYRGWMDDISRGPVPKMDFLKTCIRRMAEFKQNFFTLYTEHTFHLNTYPDLAPPGSLTAEEVKALTEYAALYHIDLIGNFQSFGHMGKILNNPFFASLAENEDILNPADEKTYSFLANVYAEVATAYNSPFFNINCDETFGLGEGKSKVMADTLGVDGIYAYHINRIDKLLKPYGKRLMMWGDIAVGNPGIIDKLPKDLIILSWGYDARESFDDAITPFRNTGFDFMVAPGVSCWNEIWPNMGNAALNISNYTRDGARFNAMGMMNTAWDDNGHNLFNYNWHGLIWGAECSWSPCTAQPGNGADEEFTNKLHDFNRHFDELMYGTQGVTALFFRMDSLRNSPVRDLLREGPFWKGLSEFNPENTSDAGLQANLDVLNAIQQLTKQVKELQNHAIRNAELIDHLLFALNRVAFTAQKNRVRILLFQAKNAVSPRDHVQLKKDLSLLNSELYEIKKEYIRLWDMENRPYWLEKNMEDYNHLARSIIELENTAFIEPRLDKESNTILAELGTVFHDRTIVYTTDGSDPALSSTVYSIPVAIHKETVLKACVIGDNSTGPVSEKKILAHKAIGRLNRLHSHYSNYNPAYSAGGDNGLTDGLTGSTSFADGRWQGFQGQDLDVELDLGSRTEIKKFSMRFFQQTYSWIVLPVDVEILISDDGMSYRSIRKITHDVPIDNRKALIQTFEAEFSGLSARYLRVVAHSIVTLPAWHPSAGQGAYLFSDEIIVE